MQFSREATITSPNSYIALRLFLPRKYRPNGFNGLQALLFLLFLLFKYNCFYPLTQVRLDVIQPELSLVIAFVYELHPFFLETCYQPIRSPDFTHITFLFPLLDLHLL